MTTADSRQIASIAIATFEDDETPAWAISMHPSEGSTWHYVLHDVPTGQFMEYDETGLADHAEMEQFVRGFYTVPNLRRLGHEFVTRIHITVQYADTESSASRQHYIDTGRYLPEDGTHSDRYQAVQALRASATGSSRTRPSRPTSPTTTARRCGCRPEPTPAAPSSG